MSTECQNTKCPIKCCTNLLCQHWKSLIVFVLIVLAIGLSNSAATFPSVHEWYPTLKRPSWTPPNWLFAPVWTVLYIFLAISGWLLWAKTGGSVAEKLKTQPIAFYFIQLALNAAWSYLFFAMKNPLYGMICISALLLSAFLTMFFSNKYNHKCAAALFIPYCLWLSYAAQLNIAIVILN